MLTNYKNRYHPLIILLYHCNMLSAEQIRSIPRSTSNDWNRFSHTTYFGFEMVEDYIEDFDYIKDVLTKKHLKRGVKCICSLSYGYRDVISEIEKNKKLLRSHSDKITFAIQRVARYGNINITDACSLFGVNRNWFYRHRKKKTCNKSIIEKCFR